MKKNRKLGNIKGRKQKEITEKRNKNERKKEKKTEKLRNI